jgi:(2Fe-2S) ferredoxin
METSIMDRARITRWPYTQPHIAPWKARQGGAATVPKPERQVLVCTNSRPPGSRKGCCAEKGSEALYERLKDLVRERGLRERIMVTRTGCLKHCSRGITVAVQPDNVFYAGVADADLEELCASHLEGGQPLARLFMPDIPWE